MSCGNTGEQATSNQLCLDQGWHLSWPLNAHVWAFPLEKGGVSGEDKDSNAQQRKKYGAANGGLCPIPMQSASGLSLTAEL